MPLDHYIAHLSPTHRVVMQVQAQLAIGVMLATLATIAYSYLQFDLSVLRVRLLLLGLEAILVAWASLLVFCALYVIADASEMRRLQRRPPIRDLPLAA